MNSSQLWLQLIKRYVYCWKIWAAIQIGILQCCSIITPPTIHSLRLERMLKAPECRCSLTPWLLRCLRRQTDCCCSIEYYSLHIAGLLWFWESGLSVKICQRACCIRFIGISILPDLAIHVYALPSCHLWTCRRSMSILLMLFNENFKLCRVVFLPAPAFLTPYCLLVECVKMF
jgi:hypothetical protein